MSDKIIPISRGEDKPGYKLSVDHEEPPQIEQVELRRVEVEFQGMMLPVVVDQNGLLYRMLPDPTNVAMPPMMTLYMIERHALCEQLAMDLVNAWATDGLDAGWPKDEEEEEDDA